MWCSSRKPAQVLTADVPTISSCRVPWICSRRPPRRVLESVPATLASVRGVCPWARGDLFPGFTVLCSQVHGSGTRCIWAPEDPSPWNCRLCFSALPSISSVLSLSMQERLCCPPLCSHRCLAGGPRLCSATLISLPSTCVLETVLPVVSQWPCGDFQYPLQRDDPEG